MLENLKQRVYKMNMMLPKNNLVTMTSGNVSGRDPETNLVVIKPSGVLYDDMTPDDMVVVDLDGNVVEGKLKPSVDTATHLYVYRHRSDVNGIVHTHSPYATSFAALGRSIPVYLTAIADEFGCAIPVGPYAKIGGEEIGKAIVDYIGESPAILMKNHGVFTIGNSPEAALKAAVMVEDTAKTVHLSLLLGTPDVIPDEEVKRAHERYMTKYGQ
ncbi:L-ribulose-5-phosphate 4-epimerase [Thermoanaerobacterium sp. PSU-2]|uniref:L-ribulose-5-phosphate 4-epimerase n=1 Tax=Thermoanaerobacterium sp. PSU-2 TaxID=1930849 RepID=UPI000A14BCB2|nr:L-ribulose-5-phosphate 4-epimerase [Thermoanaerobacterium sp. PSU-2]ORX23763.1 L-ribulose-5-phosphate 4-epimerase [Thermoanaerobacterium sp. PSU-2]HHV75003.1 L-ribulose-5-phosphate 4-epimerase [Thermoanaerobacterium sp.]